jgi:hypothetical protein
MSSICPHCKFRKSEIGDNLVCYNCGERETVRDFVEVPGPFSDKSYEMRELHRKDGYVYSFYEHEPLDRNDEPHIHVKGHGREIEYYLSEPIREKSLRPQNFPEREERNIIREVEKRREEFLRS